MKRLLLLLMLVVMGFSASAMGHPHNLFSAHRKAKQHSARLVGPRNACYLTRQTLIDYLRTTLQA